MKTITQDDIARRFGCSVEQVKALHARNAVSLRGMLNKATVTGRKVCGYTAAQLSAMVANSDRLSR